MTKNDGIAFILKNEAMPNFIKVDFARDDDLADHVRRANSAPIPLPFEVYFAAKVPDVNRLERALDLVFTANRAGRNGDFLEIDPELPRAIIELVAGAEVMLTDEDLEIDAGERININRARSGRSRRKEETAELELEVIDTNSPVICVKRA